MGRVGFWGAALLSALVLAGLAGLTAPWILSMEPAGGSWLLTPRELWLLMVFTGGALAILLAASVMVGGWGTASRGSGQRRPSADPGGGALEETAREEKALESSGGSAALDPGRWMLALGGMLLLIYMVGWLLTG